MSKRTARTILAIGVILLQAQLSSAQPAGKGKPPAPAPAPETPPAPPSLASSLTGSAKVDYESARILFGAGDYSTAFIKFKTALDASSDQRLLWNMAACEKNLRHYSRAVALLRRYANESDALVTATDKADAKALIDVMEPLTARLTVNVSEPGAEVFIDDESIGTTPIAPVILDIGIRRLRVRKGDFEEVARDVSVAGAAEVVTDVKLVRMVHEGTVSIHANAGATIALDGAVVGTGDWRGVLASGGHSLRVTADKMRPFQSEVVIQDKQAREITVSLEAEPSKGLPLWAWIVGGAVVAGGLTTAGILVFRQADPYDGPTGTLSPGVVQASRSFGF